MTQLCRLLSWAVFAWAWAMPEPGSAASSELPEYPFSASVWRYEPGGVIVLEEVLTGSASGREPPLTQSWPAGARRLILRDKFGTTLRDCVAGADYDCHWAMARIRVLSALKRDATGELIARFLHSGDDAIVEAAAEACDRFMQSRARLDLDWDLIGAAAYEEYAPLEIDTTQLFTASTPLGRSRALLTVLAWASEAVAQQRRGSWRPVPAWWVLSGRRLLAQLTGPLPARPGRPLAILIRSRCAVLFHQGLPVSCPGGADTPRMDELKAVEGVLAAEVRGSAWFESKRDVITTEDLPALERDVMESARSSKVPPWPWWTQAARVLISEDIAPSNRFQACQALASMGFHVTCGTQAEPGPTSNELAAIRVIVTEPR